MMKELNQRHCFLKYIIQRLKPQIIINIRVIIMKLVLKNHDYTTRPGYIIGTHGGGGGGGLPELALERQVAGRLWQVPLAIGGGSNVGRSVDRTDGVAGADQKVC